MPPIDSAEEYPMTPLSLDWPQSAGALLEQAKQRADLIKLIMAGTHHLESWLIENHVLPLLRTHQLGILRFELAQTPDKRSAKLAPLPDGSAFACNTDGLWLPLEEPEARHEIEHIGSRFAPGNRWRQSFAAVFEQPDQSSVDVTPFAVATLWEEITGCKPCGFEVGTLDQVEAYGLGMAAKLLHTQSRLGL